MRSTTLFENPTERRILNRRITNLLDHRPASADRRTIAEYAPSRYSDRRQQIFHMLDFHSRGPTHDWSRYALGLAVAILLVMSARGFVELSSHNVRPGTVVSGSNPVPLYRWDGFHRVAP